MQNLNTTLLSSVCTFSLSFSLGANADDSEQIELSPMSRVTSLTGVESLLALQSSKLINDFYLIPKRLGEEFNLPWTKKYVGFFQC